MLIDPFRLSIAMVPLVAYLLVIGCINLRRRPFVTAGANDLAALGVALSGLMFVGPIELFRPEAATAEFGNFVWLFLLAFYWLWVALVVLVSRPRLVVYNMTVDELRPVMAEIAAELDSQARWAGHALSLPELETELHMEGFAVMRHVTIVASGANQNLDTWNRLASMLRDSLRQVQVQTNPKAITILAIALVVLFGSSLHLMLHPQEALTAMNQMFAY